MEPVKLAATRRNTSGKGEARRLRAENQIPAIAYGKDMEATSLSLAPADLQKILAGERGRNTLIELEIDGKDRMTSLLCDFQWHPVTRHLLHADFLKVDDQTLVDVDVPLELTGKAKGVTLGGTLESVFRKLPLRCLPRDIPVKLSHDVTELGIEDTVSVKDLALPSGVTVRLPPARTIAGVFGKRAEKEEEAPAAGAAAAAPAADAKKAEPAKKEAKK